LCPLLIALSLDARAPLPLICDMADQKSNQDPARLARRLMRSCERAALATSLLGAPYVSLVLHAADLDASPILLLSDLAQHARNIALDPRVSLLLDGTDDLADRLDGPRLTLMGWAEAVADVRLRARFTARHPSSAVYAGFGDFRAYRIVVERGHLIAGFGRIEWIDRVDLGCSSDIRALAEAEPTTVTNMNERYGPALDLCAQRLLGRPETGWRITNLDPEGLDLRSGNATARLEFPAPALIAEAAFAALEGLAEKARL
jgi:heme oxygenase (biliverdin-IX-beta and delta-forming)